jgi:hypothetical protein
MEGVVDMSQAYDSTSYNVEWREYVVHMSQAYDSNMSTLHVLCRSGSQCNTYYKWRVYKQLTTATFWSFMRAAT